MIATTSNVHITQPPNGQIDLDTLRLLASHWLRDDRARAGGFDGFNPDNEDLPGNNAQKAVGVEDAIDNVLGRDTLAEIGICSSMTFGAGFEFGIAAAVAIIQAPFTNPRERLASAIAAAKREIDDVVASAHEDAVSAEVARLSAAPTQPPVWPKPKITVHPTTDDDRAKALATGIEALEAFAAKEERNRLAIRGLLRAARALADGSATLEDPAVDEAWARGLEVLGSCYHAGCTTDYAEEIGTLADDADRDLGLVSGHYVLMSGGDIKDHGTTPVNREGLADQIARFGQAESAEAGSS